MAIFQNFSFGSPLETMKKSCLNELKFWEASRNQNWSIWWKFQYSISKIGESPLHFLIGIPFSFKFLKFSTFFQKGWNDYQGSMRAIVRLQFAYQMNLSELHENGRIQYNNSDGELISIESFEKLTSIDHAQLATKATGGVVLEVIFNFFPSSKKWAKSMSLKFLLKSIRFVNSVCTRTLFS